MNNARKRELKRDVLLRVLDLVYYYDVMPDYSDEDRAYVNSCALRIAKQLNVADFNK